MKLETDKIITPIDMVISPFVGNGLPRAEVIDIYDIMFRALSKDKNAERPIKAEDQVTRFDFMYLPLFLSMGTKTSAVEADRLSILVLSLFKELVLLLNEQMIAEKINTHQLRQIREGISEAINDDYIIENTSYAELVGINVVLSMALYALGIQIDQILEANSSVTKN